MAENTVETNHLELATELTIAWLSNPNTRASAEEVPSFLETMHGAVASLSSAAAKAGTEDETAQPEYTPAVSTRKSLSSKDHIISLIDGKPYKTLRRHLARHGLTPDQYRERYGLKPDYPMVAENYAEVRRNLAKKIGLGRKPRSSEGAAPKPRADDAAVKAAAKPAAEAPAQPTPAEPAAKGAKSSPAAAKPRRKAREAAPKDSAAKPAAAKAAASESSAKAPAPKAAAKPAGRKPAAKGASKAGAKSAAPAGGSSTPDASA